MAPGRDPDGIARLFKRTRGIGESGLQRAGELGGGLVWGLADRAALIDGVLFVTEDFRRGGAGHHQHQNSDPGAPAKAAPGEPRG